MNPKELVQLGVPRGNPMGETFKFIQAFLDQNGDAKNLSREISAVLATPEAFTTDALRSAFAPTLLQPDLYLADRPPAL